MEQHEQLKRWCEEFHITFATSVWDITSAKEIAGLNPQFIKIPSACNNNSDMLNWLCDKFEGEIQISFGMTTKEEEQNDVEVIKNV